MFYLGDQFLQDNDSTSSCNESSCIDCLEEETAHRNTIFYNKNRLSMAIDDDDRLVAADHFVTRNLVNKLFSCVRVEDLNSLENYFKADVDKLCDLLQSLPDSQRKVEMLKAALDEIKVIRGVVTANCHAAIIAAVMEDCQTSKSKWRYFFSHTSIHLHWLLK